ncbi:hypothetical protein [Pseudothioclava arenosa]|uniref:Uncharacterized protein n=1 Tax=Pseudothioclava arenosa TaxID=1795308 RepID=A0A2A4CUP2_9RHOB|nr:hypothetical protein [Pseudothioclava arenosa]PCD77804.1 hypothetical protein CLN94_00305 [Pseudothioclava arenosa]
MSDRNLKDFEARLQKIEQIQKAGGAFEATGTLGRSYFDSTRPKSRRSIPLRALGMILFSALLLKAAMFSHMGPTSYDQKVAMLETGSMVEQASAWVLRADPLTRKIADSLHPIMN